MATGRVVFSLIPRRVMAMGVDGEGAQLFAGRSWCVKDWILLPT
ncbi:hypothetical protein OAK32_00725 [Mariniblastus sp.]|nr:hypothetical protein [Mariniblastus sp.]